MVIATQNPIEMEGTYPLPEAQRDRFTARISMGYPDRGAELAMLDAARLIVTARRRCEPVADAAEVRALIDAVRERARRRRRQAVRRRRWPTATRATPELRLGASPRATLHLLRAAKAQAALDGRDYVLPDDVQALAAAGAGPPAAAERGGPGRPPAARAGAGRHRRAGAAARSGKHRP